MRVVINGCFGGFGLSPRAIKRWAELHGRDCYFFVNRPVTNGKIGSSLNLNKMNPCSLEALEDSQEYFFYAFDVKNPPEFPPKDEWLELSMEEKQKLNAKYEEHSIIKPGYSIKERSDPKLIQVVEELGEAANGRFAKLKIVDIPDGTDVEIAEYDGYESVEEKHQSWS